MLWRFAPGTWAFLTAAGIMGISSSASGCVLALLELGHDLGREQLHSVADVLVRVAPRLLDEDQLIDAHGIKFADIAAGISGCADS